MTKPLIASHEDLFSSVQEHEPTRCDACGSAVASPAPTDEEGADATYGLPGEGVYLWTRGDEVRFERVPLCPSCASAIGMTALARWEIEEEEG